MILKENHVKNAIVEKIKPSDKVTYAQVRVTGMISMAYHMLVEACQQLPGPEYAHIYHHKVKYLIKQVLKLTLPIVKLINSESNIQAHFDQTGELIDKEDLLEDREMHIASVRDLIHILMTQNTNEVFSTTFALKNLREKKKLYTQEEVDILIDKVRNERNS